MSTGSSVECSQDVLQKIDKLSIEHVYRYIILKINDENEIVVEKTGDSDKTFDDFKNDLPKDKCRYGVFGLCFETNDKQKRSLSILVCHYPERDAKMWDKVKYSSGEVAILKKLGRNAIDATFHRGDHSEIDLEEIVQVMRAKLN